MEFDEWQDETDIMLRSDERARARKIWEGRGKCDDVYRRIYIYIRTEEA